MYLMIAILALLYVAHIAQMALHYQERTDWRASRSVSGIPRVVCAQGVRETSWIKAVHVRPISAVPFSQPVGVHLEVEVYQPTPFIYRGPISFELLANNYITMFVVKDDAMQQPKTLQEPVAFDLYALPYVNFLRTNTIQTQSVDLLVKSKPEPRLPSTKLNWIVNCGERSFGDVTISDQVKKALFANEDFQKLLADPVALYRQYLPDNMTSAGFKICSSNKISTHYCAMPEENHVETQPKPNP